MPLFRDVALTTQPSVDSFAAACARTIAMAILLCRATPFHFARRIGSPRYEIAAAKPNEDAADASSIAMLALSARFSTMSARRD